MSRLTDELATAALALLGIAVAGLLFAVLFMLTLGAWALGMAQIIQWMVN